MRHNLPQQLTPFIGREAELAQLQERLQGGESRLLSLVGPGGMGKTRLALQVASANQQLFPDGVFFVALAGVQSVDAIPAAIMDALQATLGTGAASPTQQLLQVLAPQKLLLVIDNFEHLTEGVDLLLAILQAAPAVTLLVTTREQLDCQAEDLFLLHGLATPTQLGLTEAGHYAAVRLFCERAYRLHKQFKLTAENCPAVVKICQLVEGMPLALELATTWLGDLDCAALAETLAHNQSILATTQRDLPARHRSMQAVFDHSWQLLGPSEQRTLSQLAICHGRVSARIASQLTGASLIDLTRLRYKSLLRIAESGYYELHPLIRGFALAKMAAEVNHATEERLAVLYTHHLVEQAPVFSGTNPQAAVVAIGRELDNVLQAWHWAEAHQRHDLLAQSVDGLGEFFAASGRNTEAEDTFLPLVRRLLAHPAAASETEQLLALRLLDKLGHSLIWRSKLAEALTSAQQLTALAQQLANQEFEARGLMHWGKALIGQGNNLAAEELMQRALALARQLAQPRLVGHVIIELSHVLRYLEKRNAAEAILLEGLAIQRALGNRTAEQRTLLYLAVNRTNDGDVQMARHYMLAAIQLLQLTANRHVESRLTDGMGLIEAMIGNYTAALAYHDSSRRISVEIRQPVQESHALRHLCTVQRILGNLALAEEQGRAALRIALEYDLPEDTCEVEQYLGYIFLAAGKLDEAAHTLQHCYDGWRAQGRTNPSYEALVGLALVDLRRGNGAQAAARLAPIVPMLLEGVPYGLCEPYDMYLAAYEVLQSAGDERVPTLLATAYTQLQAKADKLTDRALLHAFWQAPAHRKICELWQQETVVHSRVVA